MTGFIDSLLRDRGREKFSLHEQYLNHQMVKVLRTIGFDRHYVRAEGAYLFDDEGNRYLDHLSGFGTFALGRNHPRINAALTEVLQAELPNLVQLDVSILSGLLAEKLVESMPHDRLSKVFFGNSGTEAVEGAIKFARYATGRSGIVYLDHAFHGLTYGSLSMMGESIFRQGFGPMLPDFHAVPMNDLGALERVLRSRSIAAFFFEPVQGKGVNIPDDGFLCEAGRLCRKYGTLIVADEIQTGLGRTGKMWAVEHCCVEPDMLLIAKALSGGHVPVGAIVSTKQVFDKMFDRMDRSVVHGSTFGKNNLAMAAGLATLQALQEERWVDNAAARGEQLMQSLLPFVEKYDFVKQVRGRGLMLAIEFGAPKSLKLKAAWTLLSKANPGLFCQMILIPLFKEHRILAQVAGHEAPIIKLLPPLVVTEEDCKWTVDALDRTIEACHRFPGAIWELGTTLAGHAMAARRAS
ncbi:MAG: aspartate aminotransferase family protein [Myxococcota bacterium]